SPMAVCNSAMIPAQIPTSLRKSELTGLGRPRSTLHGPSKTAPAVKSSAGYAVAILRCEMTSRRTENSAQNSAVLLSAVNAIVKCRTILRSEEHTSELQSRENLVCRLLLEKKKK